MKLTAEERIIVEDNMGLVGRVIKDKVHLPSGIFTYEDLFQIGCIGLCKAAATDRGGCFSTYAYRLIWNEICDALIRATKQSQNEYRLEEGTLQVMLEEGPSNQFAQMELQMVFQRAKARATGTTAKGISCLELSAEGFKSKEIGQMMNADPATVRMWMTKARRYLKEQPEIRAAYEEVLV